MRVSTQLLVGYVAAVVAVVAVLVSGHVQLRAVSEDIEHVGEEWEETDLVAHAVSAVYAARAGEADIGLDALAAQIEAFAEEEAQQEGEHDAVEITLFDQIVVVLRQAQAPGADLPALETEMHRLAMTFWKEHTSRVPARLDEIMARGARLRMLHLGIGGCILLVSLVFLGYVQQRIARPLAAIQARVDAIGGQADRPRQVGMRHLADAIERMAGAIEERQQDLEAQVKARTHQLRHADRLGGLGKIAAAVAHEINNPLGSVGLCTDGLRHAVANGEADPAELDRYLETVRKEIDRCTRITGKLLTYARREDAPLEDVALGDIVRGAVDLVAGHARRARVRVDYAADGACVRGDAAQLQQVLVNLLLNAIDASRPGKRVRVEAARAGGQAVVSVADEGAGVAAERREEIFQPFVTTKRAGEGTGLGLAISREIVEAHGGVLVLSDADQGALFEVRLPLPQAVTA